MTATIQPPALAFAWRVAVGDPALEPGIVAHHATVSAERDLEGDGLLWILQPDESGLDASPQFDPIWRHEAQGLPGFVELVRRNREREFRIDAVRAGGDPVVCEVLTNVINGLSRLALGLPSITPALIDRLYDEPSGTFLPVAMPAITERIPLTWTAFAALALPDLPEQIGHRLVECLLDEHRFWTAVAPPSVSLDEPSFSLREHFDGLRRYWRGPTWVNSAWLVWRGMVRLGYEQQAATLARGITETVAREGLRESYDPHDGRGMGAEDFAWSALCAGAARPEQRERGSALGRGVIVEKLGSGRVGPIGAGTPRPAASQASQDRERDRDACGRRGRYGEASVSPWRLDECAGDTRLSRLRRAGLVDRVLRGPCPPRARVRRCGDGLHHRCARRIDSTARQRRDGRRHGRDADPLWGRSRRGNRRRAAPPSHRPARAACRWRGRLHDPST